LKKIYHQGFSLIEIMVGSIVILLASSFLLYGISQPVQSSIDIRLKQEALEELIKFTNEQKSLVSISEEGSTQGIETRNINIGSNNHIDATLFLDITCNYTGQYSKYCNIKTWIEWNNPQYQGEHDRLDFEVNQMVIN